MKVIEEFKVIERKTIYVPGMKIVTKFVLWICTYKLSLLKFFKLFVLMIEQILFYTFFLM